MKILYDHQAFTMQYFGGVSKSFCELISHLPNDVKYEISIKQSDNVHLMASNLIDNIEKVKLDSKKFHKYINIKGSEKLYNLLKDIHLFRTAEQVNLKCSINALKKRNFDIFHATFYDLYFLKYIGDKPFVLTVHDMMPELFPWYFRKNNTETMRKRLLCEKASIIIAVSEQTKKDLVRLFEIPDKKIIVIYHGGPEIMKKPVKDSSNGTYFLYVGQRSAYKNFDQTLRDFGTFVLKHKDIKLICTGAPFTLYEVKLIDELDLNCNVFHKSPTDKKLLSLYVNAIGFVYPSLYEGFGMPILEAFACGCPVLLNSTSCFPEIGGQGALYFNSSESGSNLPHLLEQVYSLSNGDRQILINRGFERLKNFSWQKSSDQLVNLYNGLI